MMTAHATAAGTLQLVGTSKGIAIEGPGGRLLLTSRMVGQLAEFSVSLLDILQADPDVEANGDELDGSMGEDDFHLQRSIDDSAGCPIADPGGCEHDGREPQDGY